MIKKSLFWVAALMATSFAAQSIVKIDDLHPGIVINKDMMMAADLAIWNPPAVITT